ncbi:hypothetical protein HZH66_000374 [Vespula vulgaris]|uniref:Uncharacterized protein n=1 Tax=Vespula vulgaris TaxID=7454 RepID=A0A834KR67_VESVU|nr:hypothetical protein HZH66_000374 [Vespula vulgaris]
MTSSFRWLTLPPNVELGLSDAIIPTQSKHYQITSTARRRNSNVMTAGAQKSSHDRVGSSWVGFYIGLQNPHGLAMTGVFATQRSTAITARYMDTAGWGLVPRLYRSVQWGNGTEPGMPGPCLILRTWMEHVIQGHSTTSLQTATFANKQQRSVVTYENWQLMATSNDIRRHSSINGNNR